jgi:hypothetical protein
MTVDHADQGVVAGDAVVGKHDVAVVTAADEDHLALGQRPAGPGVQACHDPQQPLRFRRLIVFRVTH